VTEIAKYAVLITYQSALYQKNPFLIEYLLQNPLPIADKSLPLQREIDRDKYCKNFGTL